MGRFFAVLIILLVAIGALGFYLDWWRLNKTSDGDEIDVTLSVDKNKIKKDTNTAIEQVQKVGESVGEQVRKTVGRSVQGKVASVNADAGAVTVRRDNDETIAIQAGADTVIRRGNDTIELADLKVDQPVTVVYDTENDKNIAQSITVVAP